MRGGGDFGHQESDDNQLDERRQLVERASEIDDIMRSTSAFNKNRVTQKERLEIGVYKFLYLLPVIVTYGLIFYIAVFYMSVRNLLQKTDFGSPADVHNSFNIWVLRVDAQSAQSVELARRGPEIRQARKRNQGLRFRGYFPVFSDGQRDFCHKNHFDSARRYS